VQEHDPHARTLLAQARAVEVRRSRRATALLSRSPTTQEETVKTRIALLVSLTALILSLSAGWLEGARADSANPALVALQRRVSTLETQLRTLSKRQRQLESSSSALTKRERQLEGYESARYAGDACAIVMVADLIQSEWIAVDQAWNGAFGHTIFGPPVSLDDRGACKSVGLTRAPGVLIPSLGAVGTIVDWLWSTSSGQPVGASADTTSSKSSKGSKATPRSSR
jgi:hypothetical protein